MHRTIVMMITTVESKMNTPTALAAAVIEVTGEWPDLLLVPE